jgi:hypothetical protein
VNENVKVRRQVAAEHGLGWREADFLVGSTVKELEESAAALARLVDTRREPEQTPPTDVFSLAAAQKAARKSLPNALCGRTSQPRDPRGRVAAGFDGAHSPTPAASPADV